ncbi:hypothetical protein ACFUCH_18750 [Streptomyces olivaceus]|uniref:hypothetical protein n=1 Tax=Streptomyces olivaceus TaxID=47716 RepID=UPI00362544E1
MDSPSLSAREQQTWQQIAAALEQDELFGRRLRTLEAHHPRRGRLGRLIPSSGRSLALLSALSLSLTIVAVALSHTPLIVAFGSVSVVSITVALVWLCARRWTAHP